MKKYRVTYEVEIEAKNIDEAEELAGKGEMKIQARLEKIKGQHGEILERVYRR